MEITKENSKKGERTKEERKPKKKTQEEMRKRRENQTLLQTPIQVVVAHKP
jgi:hypothetical protein